MLVLQLVAQLVPQLIHVASCGWRGVPTSTHHHPSTNCGSNLILLFLLLSTETHISFITHSALFTIPPLCPLSPSIHLRHAERGPKHASTERRPCHHWFCLYFCPRISLYLWFSLSAVLQMRPIFFSFVFAFSLLRLVGIWQWWVFSKLFSCQCWLNL